jgi:hypothetical protein
MIHLFSSRTLAGRTLLTGLATAFAASCAEPSGVDPDRGAPVLSVAARAAQDVSIPPALRPATLQARVRPEGQDRVVADTSLAVTPGQRLELDLRVPLRDEEDVFEVELVLFSQGDTEVFRSEPTPVTAHDAQTPVAPTEVLLEYSGPGTGATRLELDPNPATVLVGEELALQAQAFGTDGEPLGPVPVEWTTLDPDLIALADPATGLWQAGNERGLARVVGTLAPVGLADTATIFVSPPAGQISRAGGNSQDGSAGGVLSNPLRVRVRDADGIDLPGQLVVFEPGSGGSVTPVTAITGQDGRAATEWTLGPVLGDQELVARVSSNPELSVTFRAHAGAAALTSVTIAPREVRFDAVTASQALAVLAMDIFGNVVTPDDVSWSTSDDGVARVSNDGVVTARGNGEAQIVATVDGVRSDPARVVVAQAPVALELEPGDGWTLARGEVRDFEATARDRLGQPIPEARFLWSSSDPAVLEVDDDGVARGLAFGSAAITAQLVGTPSLSARAEGTVGIGALESLTVTPGEVAFDALTLTRQLSVEGRDRFGNAVPLDGLSWSSSEPGIASVSESGRVTANGQGVAEIRARVGDVTSAPVTVRVDARAVGIRVDPGSGWVLREGRRLDFVAVAFDRLGNELPHAEFEWESSNDDVLTISADGRARARDEGVVTVRVTLVGDPEVNAASTGIVID